MKGADHEVFYLTSIFAAIGIIAITWIKPAKDAKTVKQKPEPTS